MNNLIDLNSVSKIYKNAREVVAIKRVSISIKDRDFLAITGPSGSGKSTLLHVMGGLEPPTKGKVLFADKNLYQMPQAEISTWRNKRVGFIFQFYHLIEELDVRENLLAATFFKRQKYSLKRAEKLLKYLGIEDKMKAFPSQLSGGEKQRVAIARALMNDPQILLCDEPTGNLDYESQEAVAALLDKLNKEEHKTIILVTHNLDLAKRAKSTLFIKNGEINNS